jgi:hypothetical protein
LPYKVRLKTLSLNPGTNAGSHKERKGADQRRFGFLFGFHDKESESFFLSSKGPELNKGSKIYH